MKQVFYIPYRPLVRSWMMMMNGVYVQRYFQIITDPKLSYHQTDMIKLVDRTEKEIIFHLPQSRITTMKDVLPRLYPFYQKGKLRLLYQSPENETLVAVFEIEVGVRFRTH